MASKNCIEVDVVERGGLEGSSNPCEEKRGGLRVELVCGIPNTLAHGMPNELGSAMAC